MSPYITFRDINKKGELSYYILQRAYPHYVFEITTIPEDSFFINNMPITNYYMWLKFDGTILGDFIPSYKNVYDEINEIMFNASNWFYENRICTNESKYKKFKK
jgi:hypothetical protein